MENADGETIALSCDVLKVITSNGDTLFELTVDHDDRSLFVRANACKLPSGARTQGLSVVPDCSNQVCVLATIRGERP